MEGGRLADQEKEVIPCPARQTHKAYTGRSANQIGQFWRTSSKRLGTASLGQEHASGHMHVGACPEEAPSRDACVYGVIKPRQPCSRDLQY